MFPSPTRYSYSVDPGVQLTEELAVRLSRQALVDDGSATANMVPVPHGRFETPGSEGVERLLARGRPNRGSILWKTGSSDVVVWDISVDIELSNGTVTCEVRRAK
jgi:hypothetical protein